MTSKAHFTDDEWTRLKRAPFVAGMAISLADPGGPIEAFKETAATLKAVLAGAEGGDHGDFVRDIAGDSAGDAREHKNPMAGFKPTSGGTAGVEILDELREVNRIISEKATPDGRGRPVLAAGRRPVGRRRRQGGRLHGLPRPARQRGRAADARQPRRGARRAGGVSGAAA